MAENFKMVNYLKGKSITPFDAILATIAGVQFLVIVVFNLTQLENHIGYDTSTYFYTAIEMSRQGSLFLQDWAYQTTLSIDSVVPVAACFYSLTNNIFVSYGIANILATVALIALSLLLFKRIGLSKTSSLACLNLFLLLHYYPYGNEWELGYYGIMFLDNGGYSVKIIAALLSAIVVIGFAEDRKPFLGAVIAVLLAFASGLSSGLWLVALTIIPLVLGMLLYAIIREDSFKGLLKFKKPLAFLLVMLLASFIGKFATTQVLGFSSIESGMTLVPLGDLWASVWGMAQGYLSLLSAVPSNEGVIATTASGMFYAFNLVFAALGTIGLIVAFARWKKTAEQVGQMLCLAIIVWNIVALSLLDTQYGQPFMETRYLVEAYVFSLAFLGLFLDSLSPVVWKTAALAIICVGVLFCNAQSDLEYYSAKNDYYTTLLPISEAVSQYSSPVVYVYDDPVITCRNMRVVDPSKVYKSVESSRDRWGDTTRYDELSEYEGEVLVLVKEDHTSSVPQYIFRQLNLLEEGIGGFSLYSAKSNPFDLYAGFDNGFEFNIETPTTFDIVTVGQNPKDPGLLTNADSKDTYVLYGPFANAVAGEYRFTLYYDYDSDAAAEFDIASNRGQSILGSVDIPRSKSSVNVDDIHFDGSEEGVEYRVSVPAGQSIRIDRIEIARMSG